MLALQSAARCGSRRCRTCPPPALLRRTFAISPSIQLDSAPAPHASQPRAVIPELQTPLRLGTKQKGRQGWQKGVRESHERGLESAAPPEGTASATGTSEASRRRNLSQKQWQVARRRCMGHSQATLRAEVHEVMERGEMVGPVRRSIRRVARAFVEKLIASFIPCADAPPALHLRRPTIPQPNAERSPDEGAQALARAGIGSSGAVATLGNNDDGTEERGGRAVSLRVAVERAFPQRFSTEDRVFVSRCE